MRHQKKRKSLNMQRDHLKLMLRNLATSVILHENVKTTKAKAKMVQPIVEGLITKAKNKGTRDAIQQIEKVVLDENASRKLIEVLKDRYKDRPGGYTRIVKVGNRAGDAAEMVQLQLV